MERAVTLTARVQEGSQIVTIFTPPMSLATTQVDPTGSLTQAPGPV
jgi:hypothetical protein